MTNTEFLATNPTYAEAKDKFLLFSVELRDTLLAKQATLNTDHNITPRLLSDGRYGVCCDLLTAIGEGEIYHNIFALLDPDALNTADRVEKAEFEALLPEPTE